ncbi:MAG: hypothetical protein RBR41_07305 [Desulfovibrio sp.]|uniref:hypothetical protein n=1 Tax=Desulfovibrio sp. TaxID=885 RepID=UPI002A35F122|nr:hypothetical protein [Desulfovibrio sp.]MDY0259459.1 hypothetical protein [Desulfovibrio sp.]
MNQTKKNNISIPSYWEWLFKGLNGQSPGLAAYLDGWIILHISIAIIFASTVDIDAKTSLSLSIPFLGVLIAITVAWCGNITSLLCSSEIAELSTHYPGKVESYAFIVQNVILILFIALILWILKGFDILSGWFFDFLIFLFSSLAIRDSWNIILFSQLLTIARVKIILRDLNNKG